MWTICLNHVSLEGYGSYAKTEDKGLLFFSHNPITCSNKTFLPDLTSLLSSDALN